MAAEMLMYKVPIAEFDELLECPVCYTIPDQFPIFQVPML